MEPRPADGHAAAGSGPGAACTTAGSEGADDGWILRRVGSGARRRPPWRIPFQSSGGALSTAGQLIFVGNSAGKLFALDPVTGKSLWESQMAPGGVATPISYELDGKQYIAVMAGISKGRSRVLPFAA